MTYEYKQLAIILNDDEVYMLNDLILFALDYDARANCLTDKKREFAKKLVEITDETKN